MSGLRVYADLLSQPARALILLLRANNVKHELKIVSIAAGENRTAEYKSIHPFGKIPAIVDDGFKVFESIAIVRYLTRKYEIADHWYPKSLERQARVDEYLEWQHTGFRVPLAWFFFNKIVKPLLMGETPDEKEIQTLKKRMELALDDFENVWMKDGPFVVGNEISVADLFALCEIDQLPAAGYDPTQGRPKMTSWLDRVRKELNPHYQEVIKPLKQFTENISAMK